MNVLNYINDIKLLPYELGDEISHSGADGQVFHIKNDPDKVIKLSIFYSYDEYIIEHHYSNIENKYKTVINNPQKSIVKVFNINYIHHKVYGKCTIAKNYIIYYSIMEKLIPITKDEDKILKSLCDLKNNKINTFSFPKIVDELKHYYLFDRDKVLDFYDGLDSSIVIHNDFHRRNIMKDNDGNFKLIDLDRISIKS